MAAAATPRAAAVLLLLSRLATADVYISELLASNKRGLPTPGRPWAPDGKVSCTGLAQIARAPWPSVLTKNPY
jgi:hypothetical protein